MPRCPGTSAQQEKVKSVVKVWEQYANITFEHTESQDATLHITFDQFHGSWSFTGHDAKSCPLAEPTMNLAWVEDTEEVSDTDRGVILHEFGHVLGLKHEHQSPIHGGKVTLNERGMSGYYDKRVFANRNSAILEFHTTDQRWTETDVREQILQVYNEKEVTNYSRVDLRSKMMYVYRCPTPPALT